MRRVLEVGFLTLALAGPSVPAAAAEDEPIKAIDRARVVGPPVLDTSAAAGIYIWLEDGWYQVAAVTSLPFGTKERVTRTYKVAISSTKDIADKLGNFKREGKGQKQMKLIVDVGANPERAQFQTEGDITISGASDGHDAIPIFVGPLSRRGAPAVKIARLGQTDPVPAKHARRSAPKK
jgi:hypothetical protein